MSWLSKILGGGALGAVGAAVGGPVGAGLGILGGLLGGGNKQAGAAGGKQYGQAGVTVPGLDQDQGFDEEGARNAFFEGYLSELQNQQPTFFNAPAALSGQPLGQPQGASPSGGRYSGRQQAANQKGGMSYPAGPSSASTMFDEKWGKGGGGEGRGAGGDGPSRRQVARGRVPGQDSHWSEDTFVNQLPYQPTARVLLQTWLERRRTQARHEAYQRAMEQQDRENLIYRGEDAGIRDLPPASENTWHRQRGPKRLEGSLRGRGGGEGRGGGGGEGRGAGGDSLGNWWQRFTGGGGQQQAATPAQPAAPDPNSNEWWRQQLGSIYQQGGAAGAAGALQQPFTQYMQTALSGQQTLPRELYDLAMQQGSRTINAQAANARQSLGQDFGERGLLRSGLFSRGLVGVERGRLGAFGALTSGLQQQNLQSAFEGQRAAAGMYPGLLSTQAGMTSDLASRWLQMRALELERQRLGMQQGYYDDLNENSFWDSIGGVLGSVGGLFGGSSGGGNEIKNKLFT